MNSKFYHKRSLPYVIILLLISLLPVFFLLKSGFPITDDGSWLIIRFTAFFEAFRSGQLPVRFLLRLNNGFGYPVSDFLYPLYLYLATPIHVIGFGFVNSIKILLIANIFAASLFSFLWLRKRFDNLSALLGSLSFVLAPYFLFDLFRRGSFGEVLSLSVVPFILWQIERRSLIFLSFGFFFLVLSHNTLAAFFIPLLVIYALLTKNNLKIFFTSLILGIGMSSFFFIPALYDLQYTVFLSTKISSFYDYLFSLKDYYLIGLSSVVVVVLGFYLMIRKRELRKEGFLVFAVISTIVIILLQLPVSRFFWELFPFKNFIQFPFRLLSVFVVLVSFISGFVVFNMPKRLKIIFVLIISVLLLLQGVYVLNNTRYEVHPDAFYSTNQATTTVANEYYSKNFRLENNLDYQNKIRIKGNGNISNISSNSKKISFHSSAPAPVTAQVGVMYFPGWKATVNGKDQDVKVDSTGVINLELEKGDNTVNLEFGETAQRQIADIISIISFVALFGIYLLIRNKKITL
jgi:hypothetical protein